MDALKTIQRVVRGPGAGAEPSDLDVVILAADQRPPPAADLAAAVAHVRERAPSAVWASTTTPRAVFPLLWLREDTVRALVARPSVVDPFALDWRARLHDDAVASRPAAACAWTLPVAAWASWVDGALREAPSAWLSSVSVPVEWDPLDAASWEPDGWCPPAGESADASGLIHTRAFARVGVLGNPSDGFFGKTISVTVANFAAEVWLQPNPLPAPSSSSSSSSSSTSSSSSSSSPASSPSSSPLLSSSASSLSAERITLVPHPFFDPTSFASLDEVAAVAGREGYVGGLRLFHAALFRLAKHCREHDVQLPRRGFTAWYHTTVPRQVGLAGSSALLTAFVRAVFQHYGIGADPRTIGLPFETVPAFVLAVEVEELGISAGLQDRVVQWYEGAIRMDFARSLVERRKHGHYHRIPIALLPPLFLAYAPDPKDSGKVHLPVKQRWLAGDEEVVRGMDAIARNVDDATDVFRAAATGMSTVTDATTAASATVAADLKASAHARLSRAEVAHRLAALFTRNFDGRRAVFGDGAIASHNHQMVGIARRLGAAAKLPGSGGAVLGVCDVLGMLDAGSLTADDVGEGAVEAGLATTHTSGPGASSDVRAHVTASDAVFEAVVRVAMSRLKEAYASEGFVLIPLVPVEPADPWAGASDRGSPEEVFPRLTPLDE